MSEDFPPPSFTPARRWSAGLSVCLSIAAVLAMMVSLNYLASRHHLRVQTGSSSIPALTPVTARVLSSLTNNVKVVVFFDRRESVYGRVKELLKQYELRSPRIQVEYVDPVSFKGRAQEIQARYKFNEEEAGNRVIFDGGGRVKTVLGSQLSEYDYSGVARKREIKTVGFKGEQLFTSALYALVDPRPVKAYFLTDHDENDPGNASPELVTAFSKFAALLQDSGMTWAPLSILTGGIPNDCQLLVIANPQKFFLASELEKVEQYLAQGGRMLALFPSSKTRTGLERVLSAWGVELGNNRVIDLPQSAANASRLLVDRFGDHAIVKPLLRSRLEMLLPRSVTPANPQGRSADAAKVSELLRTHETGATLNTATMRTERSGAIPIAAAIEKGTIQGVGADRGATRIVVVGESMFLSNPMLESQANYNFAANCVNWLVNREILLEGIGSQPIQEYTIVLTASQMETVSWIMLAGAPGAALLFGVITWARRRA